LADLDGKFEETLKIKKSDVAY